MPQRIAPELRSKTFAGVELFLDLCHAARSIADVDLESLVIYFCVVEATMRPLMVVGDPSNGSDHPKSGSGGAISMLLVADKLGFPRETVRRKIKSMITQGILEQDADGRILASTQLTRPQSRKAAEAMYVAVRRYLTRLRELDVPPPG